MKRTGDRTDIALSILVGILAAAFLLRVAGQAIQRWAPQSFLPQFEAWQGSGLPYPLLLACQVVILVALALAIFGMARGRRVLGRKAGRAVIAVGALYFITMAARLLLGLTIWPDVHWFTAWISTTLHLALASIVMLWGWHQSRAAKPAPFPLSQQ